jgi:hypothetical protein
MEKLTTAAAIAALVLAITGCAAAPESDAENAEWYDAYYADMDRCERAGGTLMVEKLWASRLAREVRPGSRYTCYMRERNGPAWTRSAWYRQVTIRQK